MPEALRDLLDRYFLQNKNLKIVDLDKPLLEKLQSFAKDEALEVDIPQNKQILHTILWDMVMERVTQPTFDENRIYSNITGFQLTEYGEKLLQGLPIDRPNQYLDYLKSKVPTIQFDPQIIVYVRENLACYNLSCYFASSVMLGVAAEKLFELLISIC